MRDKVRVRSYIMTVHAAEEMADDGLSVFDVEHCILTGEIVERQQDVKTDEWKYVVQGQSLEGKSFSVVTKISITGKLVFITVFA